MSDHYDLATIQKYIDDGIQESLTLEYKAAEAIGRSDGKLKEISKDVSAMANSSGGLLVYGVKEFSQPDKRHLPEIIDPIDQTQFSKEWLEQVINSIRPRIQGVVIYPVALNNTRGSVIYVVEIPQSTAAHQAKDWRYYKRFNFQSIPMEDYEIRDVMNRAFIPDVDIGFTLRRIVDDAKPYASRRLRISITNKSSQVINRFKLILRLKNIGFSDPNSYFVTEITELGDDKTFSYSYWASEDDSLDMEMVYQSVEVLFPKESISIGGYKLNWTFPDEVKWNNEQWIEDIKDKDITLDWTLYADNMSPKSGNIPIYTLPVS